MHNNKVLNGSFKDDDKLKNKSIFPLDDQPHHDDFIREEDE